MKHSLQLSLKLIEVIEQFRLNTGRIAEQHALSSAQLLTLLKLYREDNIVMRDLAHKMHCDASNITGITDKLIAHGLIERKEAPEDRRAKVISLTPRGKAVAESIMPQLPAMSGVSNLSKQDQDLFNQLLQKILKK